MIDWYVIEYLFPESFKRFSNIMFPNVGVISVSTLYHYDIKKLYYFFDKEGIYLNIERCYSYQWVYHISFDNGAVFSNGNETRNSRDEIEIDGFTECFKLLDKKLR